MRLRIVQNPSVLAVYGPAVAPEPEVREPWIEKQNKL